MRARGEKVDVLGWTKSYDHLGNPFWPGHSDIKHLIKNVWVAWKDYGCIPQSDVFHINTEYRRFIVKTLRKQERIHWDECSTDMYNHTGAHCFWKKHTANIIYIRRVHGRTFPSRLFWAGKYPNMYRRNLKYNGIGGGHKTYIWQRLIVWQQDGKKFNKPRTKKKTRGWKL